jgi:GNAT superfamily N-acetyltransferase
MRSDFTTARDGYEVSDAPARLDLDVIHGFLTAAYWSPGISRDLVARAIGNSLCFGLYRDGVQVGFARFVTDRATFAYLADVFVLPGHRGRGLASWMVGTALSHPALAGLRRLLLATRDQHKLYARLGFAPLSRPERFMEIHDPDVYAR